MLSEASGSALELVPSCLFTVAIMQSINYTSKARGGRAERSSANGRENLIVRRGSEAGGSKRAENLIAGGGTYGQAQHSFFF